jgi:conjugal transfer pilus assembly protein TraF
MFPLILALVVTATANTVKDKPDKGWFFYEEPPKKEKKEKKKKTVKIPVVKPKEKKEENKEKKKDFQFPVRPEAPEPVKEFLLNPSEQTAKAFLEWQSKYLNHLRKIGFSLREAYLKYGTQIYNVAGYPETPQFADLYNAKKDYFFAQTIKKFKDKLGYIFFYEKGCPYCEAEKRIVIYLHNLGISIRGVSLNEIDKNLPFKSVVSVELFKRYSIQSVPTLLVVFEKDNGEVKTAVVGRGLTPLDQIERNTLMFLSVIGELKLKDFNPNYNGFFGKPISEELK